MGLLRAPETLITLVPRQYPDGWVEEDARYPFWMTTTGAIVKWSLFLAFLGIILVYLILGHLHAKRRIRNGLLPYAYHRWLISRSELARVDPQYARHAQPQPQYPYRPNADYYITNMVPLPPPVYDANAPRPPKYDANVLNPPPPAYDGRGGPGSPVGATKVDAGQQSSEQYEAPARPPPSAALRPQDTANSNNPYRN